jgi:hypothetical protein
MVSGFVWLSANTRYFRRKNTVSYDIEKLETPNPSTIPAVSGTNWNNP